MILHIMDDLILRKYRYMVTIMNILPYINKFIMFDLFHNQIIHAFQTNNHYYMYILKEEQHIQVNKHQYMFYFIYIYLQFIHSQKHIIFYFLLHNINNYMLYYIILCIQVIIPHLLHKHKMYNYHRNFYCYYLMDKHIIQNNYKHKYFPRNISIQDHIMYNY